MLRTRLASLALAASLSLTTGCLSFPRPWGTAAAPCCCPPVSCCPTASCCGCDGVVAGYGGVVATPCCTSHAIPPAVTAGPILTPPSAIPGPPAIPEAGALAPVPNTRLVPLPQAPATPYTP